MSFKEYLEQETTNSVDLGEASSEASSEGMFSFTSTKPWELVIKSSDGKNTMTFAVPSMLEASVSTLVKKSKGFKMSGTINTK